jgi:hypothetical protein
MSHEADYQRIQEVVASVHAPLGLRERVEAQRTRAIAPRQAFARRLRATGGLAAAAAVAGAVVALVVPSGNAPGVFDAVALASRGPALAAPPADPARPSRLRRSVAGVPFPSWSGTRWRAVGQRSDRLAGRDAATVFYAGPGGTRLAYTIVSGGPLAWPRGAAVRVHDGVEVRVLRRGGRVVATWRERGHQCVISAPASVPAARMVQLASRAPYA